MDGSDAWAFFAEEAERAEAPLYARLARGIGGDEELRAFASSARPGQPHANVILAAVHFLLLRGAAHPLRGFYRNLGGDSEGDPFQAFRDFVVAHRESLSPLIAARVTNTNEVGRSAFLLPAFLELARQAGEPLHLIEIGPSAGLNLVWDRYGVEYSRGEERFRSGAAKAPLVLESRLHGDRIPPLGAPPAVAHRVGLERDRVDLADPDARDWLKALVWPDHVARFERLEKALALGLHPEIRAGDALDLLGDALAEAPLDHTLCVYHTMVTYQFSRDMREALEAILIMAGLRRTVWRVAFEGTLQGENALELIRYRDGTVARQKLASCHPHGGWIEWQTV